MLLPRKVKYRKQQRGGRLKGKATSAHSLAFGKFGLKSVGHAWITSRQIEAGRRAITRYIKREGKVWIRIFPHQSVSATPNETRMGGGKGSISHYIARVYPGTLLFEMDGVSTPVAKAALRLAGHKMPVPTRFISREREDEQ